MPQGSTSLKYVFLWASSPVSHNMCNPSGIQFLINSISPPCMSQEWGKTIVTAAFTMDSKGTLDLHQSSQDSALVLSTLLSRQVPTKH